MGKGSYDLRASFNTVYFTYILCSKCKKPTLPDPFHGVLAVIYRVPPLL